MPHEAFWWRFRSRSFIRNISPPSINRVDKNNNNNKRNAIGPTNKNETENKGISLSQSAYGMLNSYKMKPSIVYVW